jgi:hypothetical protein
LASVTRSPISTLSTGCSLGTGSSVKRRRWRLPISIRTLNQEYDADDRHEHEHAYQQADQDSGAHVNDC